MAYHSDTRLNNTDSSSTSLLCMKGGVAETESPSVNTWFSVRNGI